MSETCFACDRKLGKSAQLVDTRDDQTVYVGRECFKLVKRAGERGHQPPKGGPRLYLLPRLEKITDNQRRTLDRLNSYRPLRNGPPGWLSTRQFDALTVRSLIRRGLVEPSTTIDWMLRDNLDDVSIRITKKGQAIVA